MTEPNSRANSGEAHTHSLSNNTKETPSKSRIQEVLTKLDSQSAPNIDSQVQAEDPWRGTLAFPTPARREIHGNLYNLDHTIIKFPFNIAVI